MTGHNSSELRLLLKNSTILLTGRILADLFGLAVTIITVRALGVGLFGQFALILAYVAVVERLCSFQSWVPLVKFGAEALHAGSAVDFMSYVRKSAVLDLGGGVAGSLLGVAGTMLFAGTQGWHSELNYLAAVFSCSILCKNNGTPTAILRLFNRFDLLTLQNFSASLFTLAGAMLAFCYDFKVAGFVIALLLSHLLAAVILWLLALRELKQAGMSHLFFGKVDDWGNFGTFSLWNFINTILDLPAKKLDVIIVGALASFEAAGVYKIIKQILKAPTLVSDAAYQSVYPQLARQIACGQRQAANRFVLKTAMFLVLITGVPAAIVGLTSFWWFPRIFAVDFDGALPTLNYFLVCKVLAMATVAVHPLFIACGKIKYNPIILIVANLLYLTVAWQTIGVYGLKGLAFAYGLQITCVILMKYLILKADTASADLKGNI